jgi:5'-3' exonuclease
MTDTLAQKNKIPTLEEAAQMPDVILNNTDGFQHRIDWNKNICVVDLSYLTYTRFFGVRDWYQRAFADKQIATDHNWTADTDFMAKFYALFTKKLFAVCRQKLVPTSNIVFAIDCRHNDNWRVLATQSYKETRKDSHAKNNFSNFDIFPYIRRAVIAPLQREFGNLVLKHNNLEADDMVALFVRAARERHMPANPGCHIYIMANDRDYIQICDAFVHLIDLNDKPISDQIFAPGTGMDARKFLLRKILCGDTSDNIAGCYFNKDFLVKHGVVCKRPQLKASDKVLAALFSNPTSFAELDRILAVVNNYHSSATPSVNDSNQQPSQPEYPDNLKTALAVFKDDLFVSNARLVDFANIPVKYATEVQMWMQHANI